MRFLRYVASAAVFAACAFIADDACAAENVKRIGIAGGFAGVAGSEGNFSGYGGAVLGSHALTDAWALAGNVTATSNKIVANGGRSHVLSEAVGLNYSLDVLQIVPYFGFYAAVYEIGGGGAKSQVKLGMQLALGLDYILTREWIVGIDLRAHALPADFARSPEDPTPFYATTFVTAEYAWGWF